MVRRTAKVYFEVTNACNFRCDFCPIQVSTRPPHQMDFDLLLKGLDGVVREKVTDCVGFHVLGEPLLYPRLFDAIAYARSYGLRTELNTNGSLLNPDRIQRLADAGLNTLTISLQTDQTEHACRGTTLPYRRYYDSLIEATRLANEHGNLEVVVCSMDTSTRRLFDVDAAMRLSQRRADYRYKLRCLMADLCEAIHVDPPSAAALFRLNLTEPVMIRLSERVAVYAQPFGDWGNAFTSRTVRPAWFGACGYALENIGVLSNGDVTICCADFDGHTSLGNLRDHDIAELLASEQANRIREGFRRLRPVHPYCKRCMGSASRTMAIIKGVVSIYLFRTLNFQPARVRRVELHE